MPALLPGAEEALVRPDERGLGLHTWRRNDRIAVTSASIVARPQRVWRLHQRCHPGGATPHSAWVGHTQQRAVGRLSAKTSCRHPHTTGTVIITIQITPDSRYSNICRGAHTLFAPWLQSHRCVQRFHCRCRLCRPRPRPKLRWRASTAVG